MARKEEKAPQQEAFLLPEGRVINHALFVRDAFNDQAKPKYKIEICIPGTPEDNEELAALEDMLLDAADELHGPGTGDDDDLILPLLSGDKLAKKREKKGKDGDAYKGMTVIRADTLYNADGQEADGGIQVFGMDANRLPLSRKGDVYPGCYGKVAVVIGKYTDSEEAPGLKFYLNAFQLTKDGEKLVKSADRSSLFKPVANSGGGTRRRRRSRDED